MQHILLARPQVVLVDVHLPDGGGRAIIEQVDGSWAEAVFLALSVSDGADDVVAIIRGGARGYVTKTIEPQALVDAIVRVHEGDAVFSPRLAGFVLDAFSSQVPAPSDPELDHMTVQVARFADRMHVHAIGYLTRHPQHPGVDRGDVHLGIGHVDRTGAPLAGEECEFLELAVMFQGLAAEPGEACLHGLHVVAHARPGRVELDAIAAHDVCADLDAESEAELAAGGLLQLPRDLRSHRRAPWKRDRDPGAQLQRRCRHRCHRRGQVGGAGALGEEDPVEAGILDGAGRRAHARQRLGGEHHVDLHVAGRYPGHAIVTGVGRGRRRSHCRPHRTSGAWGVTNARCRTTFHHLGAGGCRPEWAATSGGTMSEFDIVVRGGTVVDGTGAPARRADVAIKDARIVAVEEDIDGSSRRTIDAGGRLVTPGFVDIHTHLDAQLAWDPVASSSCYHGVTSVVMGNCGVTFAPCKPEDRTYLAELMESVEDIPRGAILDGLPWDWVTYGEYLGSIARMPKGVNVGGMVGHCALRQYAMGERGIGKEVPTADDLAVMCDLLEEAMQAGALGFSTSRTYLHRVPDGRPVPGTYAEPAELLAFADVLGRHGAGVFESASRIGEGERDSPDVPLTRAELSWMGDVSRRSGRPVSFGLTQHDSRPDLYARVIGFAKEENATGAVVRPQTTARSVGILFSLDTRSPFDRAAAWQELNALYNGKKITAIRDATFRARLIEEAESNPPGLDLTRLFIVTHGDDARYDLDPDTSLAAEAARRGISAAAAYLELVLESNGNVVLSYPFLNQRLDAVEEMLDDPLVTLGLADAGAHVGQILDASQPTFFLTYWIRQRRRWSVEEAVRRLTSDTADLFGIIDRGRLVPGAHADVNVIDWEGLGLPPPTYAYDFPGGAGRYVQLARGYDYTLVNGEVFMDHGEHTGAFAGTLLKNGHAQ